MAPSSALYLMLVDRYATGNLIAEMNVDWNDTNSQELVLRGGKGTLRYKVVIPAGGSLTVEAREIGIDVIGALYVGVKRSLEFTSVLISGNRDGQVVA